MGLDINTHKTKIMKLMMTHERSVAVDGHHLEIFERFVYLGRTLCEDGDVTQEVRALNVKSMAAFNGLNNVWSSKGHHT